MKVPAFARKLMPGSLTTRRRYAAVAIGLAALLALGGIAWAAGLGGAAPQAGTAGLRAPTSGPPSQAAVSAEPTAEPSATASEPAGTGGAESTEPGPAAAPPAGPAPVETDPAPVDRSGKSEAELAAIAQPTAAPVDLKAKKTVRGGISATITDMSAVQGEAKGIGEIAGPAVRFTVTVVNDTEAALSLDSAVVNVSYGDDSQPASQLSGPDPVAFPASVKPGDKGTGVFIFAIPLDARDKVVIHFNLEAETPIATFAGRAPA